MEVDQQLLIGLHGKTLFQGDGYSTWATASSKTGISVNNNGGNQGHVHTLNSHTHSVNVVQPSYVVKFWLRTA